jgi:hypothetical protein
MEKEPLLGNLYVDTRILDTSLNNLQRIKY